MCTSIKLVSKITLLALLLPAGGISAMEYGDMPTPVGTVHTTASWIYKKFTGSQVVVEQAVPAVLAVPENAQAVQEAFAVQAPVAAAVIAAPSGNTSKTVALLIAGGALTFWAGKKIYNWVTTKQVPTKLKNGE